MNAHQRRRKRHINKQLEIDKELAYRANFSITLDFANEFSKSLDLYESEEFTKERILSDMKKCMRSLKEEIKGCRTIKEVCNLLDEKEIKFSELDL